MLVNLPYHIMKFIQLGNEIIELIATYKSFLPSTLELFRINLTPQKMNEIIDHYSRNSFKDIRTINGASYLGCIHILEWWKNSKLQLKYNEDVFNYVTHGGKVKVLEWWKNSGLKLKYNEDVIYYASYYSHIDVLEWWKDSGLLLKCDKKIATLVGFFTK